MKRVDSEALSEVDRALGITGQGAGVTEFADRDLTQVFDVGPSARRGRTLAAGTGVFIGQLSNVHTDAETLFTTVNPYEITVGAIPPYPSPMPRHLDVWILGASVEQQSGAGTFAGLLQASQPFQGFGVNDSGVAVVRNQALTLAHWDAVVTVGDEVGITEQGNTWVPIRMRLARSLNTEVIFRSTSSLTSTFNCQVLFGVFPVGLGQDVLL